MKIPADRIIIKDMAFYGYHGVLPAEKELGQNFLVSLELYLDLKKPGETDNVEDTIDYVDIYHAIKEVMEGPSFNLLEALAENIADKILRFPLERVVVEVKKTSPPMQAQLSSIGVKITRDKSNKE